jgi:hypothetical protein
MQLFGDLDTLYLAEYIGLIGLVVLIEWIVKGN